jgi:hypothetical protein
MQQRVQEEVKDEFYVFIQSCLSCKNEVIYPQVLSLNRVIQSWGPVRTLFRVILQVSDQLSVAYSYLLINVLNVEVYNAVSNIVYTVSYHFLLITCL